MPFETVSQLPAYSLLKGMPRCDHAGFLELEGGTERYMRAFAAELTRVEVRVGLGVRTVTRRSESGGAFVVVDDAGAAHTFDRLIVAISARDAAPLLEGVIGVAEMQAEVADFRPQRRIKARFEANTHRSDLERQTRAPWARNPLDA